MMNEVVLDSCVFSKLFLQETDRQDAIELISYFSQNQYKILVPSLFLYEVMSIAGASQYSLLKVHGLINQFKRVNLEVIEVGEDVIIQAIEIANSGHKKSGFPSFYDASYHALAIINKCQFITADKRHVVKAKNFGYVTLLSDWKRKF